MATFERLRIFYYVAKEGSIRKACPLLETTESRISRHLLELEEELQQKLFIRRKTGLELTPRGSELYSAIHISINNIEQSLKEFGQQKSKTRAIRIVTTTGVISIILARAVTVFLKEHKDIDVKIYTTNEDVTFNSLTVDIGLMPKIMDEQGLSQQKILTFHSRLFASKEYIEEFGMPKSIEDLSSHRLIGFYPDLPGNRGNADWHLRKGTNGEYRRACLAINSVIGQYDAARMGLGIFAVAKEFPFVHEGDLIPVLPEEDTVNFEVYFIRRAGEFPSEEVELFYNFIKKYFSSYDR